VHALKTSKVASRRSTVSPEDWPALLRKLDRIDPGFRD
jgi:hypothetical protein